MDGHIIATSVVSTTSLSEHVPVTSSWGRGFVTASSSQLLLHVRSRWRRQIDI